MIRGEFEATGRPVVSVVIQFPNYGRNLPVRFLLDSGAGRTILSSDQARHLQRLGIQVSSLPFAPPSIGVGGSTPTRSIDGNLTFVRHDLTSMYTKAVTLYVLEPSATSPSIPSLLGRSEIFDFSLVIDRKNDQVILYE